MAAEHHLWGLCLAPCSKRRGEGTWTEHSCSVRSCPGGKTLQILQLAEPRQQLTWGQLPSPPPWPQLRWRFSQGQGNPPLSGLLPLLSAAGPSDCHLEIPFLLLWCQGTACLHLAASALPSTALPLAKFPSAVPSERHNSLVADLFLLPAYELSKECFSLRKTSFPLSNLDAVCLAKAFKGYGFRTVTILKRA